jgi:hypothetical protein
LIRASVRGVRFPLDADRRNNAATEMLSIINTVSFLIIDDSGRIGEAS